MTQFVCLCCFLIFYSWIGEYPIVKNSKIYSVIVISDTASIPIECRFIISYNLYILHVRFTRYCRKKRLGNISINGRCFKNVKNLLKNIRNRNLCLEKMVKKCGFKKILVEFFGSRDIRNIIAVKFQCSILS